jgi:hypothetical protein
MNQLHPQWVVDLNAFTAGLEAVSDIVRRDGIRDPQLLRAIADTTDQSTPFDRGWVRGLRVIASAIQDGEWGPS